MRILVIDDHQLFLDGLRVTLLQQNPKTSVITRNSVEAALELLIDDVLFDLILLDLNMPHMDGQAFLQSLHERRLLIPTVVISADENPQHIQQALNQGALGFIPKSHSAAAMKKAISRVMDGDIYLPADTERAIHQLKRRCAKGNDGTEPGSVNLTKRQLAVLKLMAKGYSNQKIASTLYITEHTVKSHIRVLFDVLSGNNRTECVLEAMRRGFICAQSETPLH